MSKMMISLPEVYQRYLKYESATLGVSMSAIIRDALNMHANRTTLTPTPPPLDEIDMGARAFSRLEAARDWYIATGPHPVEFEIWYQLQGQAAGGYGQYGPDVTRPPVVITSNKK